MRTRDGAHDARRSTTGPRATAPRARRPSRGARSVRLRTTVACGSAPRARRRRVDGHARCAARCGGTRGAGCLRRRRGVEGVLLLHPLGVQYAQRAGACRHASSVHRAHHLVGALARHAGGRHAAAVARVARRARRSSSLAGRRTPPRSPSRRARRRRVGRRQLVLGHAPRGDDGGGSERRKKNSIASPASLAALVLDAHAVVLAARLDDLRSWVGSSSVLPPSCTTISLSSTACMSSTDLMPSLLRCWSSAGAMSLRRVACETWCASMDM